MVCRQLCARVGEPLPLPTCHLTPPSSQVWGPEACAGPPAGPGGHTQPGPGWGASWRPALRQALSGAAPCPPGGRPAGSVLPAPTFHQAPCARPRRQGQVPRRWADGFWEGRGAARRSRETGPPRLVTRQPPDPRPRGPARPHACSPRAGAWPRFQRSPGALRPPRAAGAGPAGSLGFVSARGT